MSWKDRSRLVSAAPAHAGGTQPRPGGASGGSWRERSRLVDDQIPAAPTATPPASPSQPDSALAEGASSFLQGLMRRVATPRGVFKTATEPITRPLSFAGRTVRDNPEAAVEALPVIMEGAAGVAANVGRTTPIAAAPGMGLAALTGAGAEGFRQVGRTLLGKDPVEGGGGVPAQVKAMMKAGGAAATGEGLGRGAGSAMRFIKNRGRNLVEGAASLAAGKRGAGEVVVRNPEVTRPGFYTPERMEGFAQDVAGAVGGRRDEAQAALEAAAEAVARSGKRAPLNDVVASARDLAGKMRIGQTGVKAAVPEDVRRVEQLLQEFNEQFSEPQIVGGIRTGQTGPRTTADAGELLRLRQRLDSEIDYAADVKSKTEAFLKEMRDRVDKTIAHSFPEIKVHDAAYQVALRNERAMKAYGIKPGKPLAEYTPQDLEALESKIRLSLRKGELSQKQLEAIDHALGTNFLERAQELAAAAPAVPGEAPAFERFVRMARVPIPFLPTVSVPVTSRAVGATLRKVKPVARKVVAGARAAAPYLPAVIRSAIANIRRED